MSQGHAGAPDYPIGRLWIETEIAADRLNRQAVTQALLFQAAALSVMEKKGGQHFNDLIRKLSDGQ